MMENNCERNGNPFDYTVLCSTSVPTVYAASRYLRQLIPSSKTLLPVMALWRALLSLLFVMGAIPAVQASAAQTMAMSLAEDRFVGGEQIVVSERVYGDLIAAAGELEVLAEVSGDLLAFGGQVEIVGGSEQDAYIAGGQVFINSNIAGNMRAAGGEIVLQPGAKIGGNSSLAAGKLDVSGEINGYLLAAGGTIVINGPISGDVRLAAESIELGPNARIGGKLLYTSENDLYRDDAAVVLGTIDRLPWPEQATHERHIAGVFPGYVLWTLGLCLLSAAILALLPQLVVNVSKELRQHLGLSVLLGIAVLLGTPLIIVFLAITVVGVPMALLLLFSYPVVLLLAYIYAAITLADFVLQRYAAARASQQLYRILAAALTIMLLSIVALVPFFGGLLVLLLLLGGSGAQLLQIHQQQGSPTVSQQ